MELCFPQLHNASCRRPSSHWAEAVLLNVVLAAISLATTTLNLLVIISVSHFRQLHTPTNNLLLSLAVSDLLVGLLSMPIEIYKKSGCWALGDLACIFYNYVSYIVTSASVANMLFISADRYVAICDPLRYPGTVTITRARVCVCLCWFCSVFHCTFILLEDLAVPGRHHMCQGQCVIIVDYAAGTADLVLTFVAPIATISILYMRVFVTAVSQARAMRTHAQVAGAQPPGAAAAKRAELKAARTLGVLVLVFLICFCPYYCFFLAAGELLTSYSEFFLLFLFYCNSTINPLIYALFYPWFRKAARIILTLQVLQGGSSRANVL